MLVTASFLLVGRHIDDRSVGSTYHVDFVVAWVEGQQVAPDELCLLVKPVNVENVSLFLYLLHDFLFVKLFAFASLEFKLF